MRELFCREKVGEVVVLHELAGGEVGAPGGEDFERCFMREAIVSLLPMLQYRAVEGRETAVGATHRGWFYPHQNGASLFGLSTLWSQRWSKGAEHAEKILYHDAHDSEQSNYRG